MPQAKTTTEELVFTPEILRAQAACDVILVCEHASNAFPAPWGDLGLRADQKVSHAAWDPGALAVAKGLSRRLDATLVHATISRDERLARTRAIYQPWANALHNLIAERIALGRRPVIVTIHSFTPVYFGQPRAVEFGVIHDADPTLSEAVLAAAKFLTLLNAALNAPYSAADDVTHSLRLHATPYGLLNTMLEIRNDLIATPGDQEFMADQLAQVLNMGLAEIQKQAKAS
jgi:predicted N-formylglutamate amidohydrolase